MFICRPRLVCHISVVPSQSDLWPLTSTRCFPPHGCQVLWNQGSPGFQVQGLAPLFLLVLSLHLLVLWSRFEFLYVSFDLWDSVYLFWQILWVLTFTCLSRLSAQLLCYLLYLGNIIQENLLWLSCFHLGLNNLFLILKLVLQPCSSFLTAFRLMSLIKDANMDKIWYEMTDYCGVWGNPIISSNPIIIMDDVPFCTIEIFSDFSDNYICMLEKNPLKCTLIGQLQDFLAALLHHHELEHFMTMFNSQQWEEKEAKRRKYFFFYQKKTWLTQ